MAAIAALTAALNTREGVNDILSDLPIEANTNVYVGSIAALNAAGNLVPASDAAALHVLGCFRGTTRTIDPNLVGSDAINNPGLAGAITGNVKRGIFRWLNSVDHPVTKAMIGQPAFVESDQAVNFTGGAHFVMAGLIVDVDSQGVWVDTRRLGSQIGLYTPTQNSLTDNGGGAAAAPVAGVRTIAAITHATNAGSADYAPTQNAISDLAAELNLVKSDLAALVARLG